MHLNDCEVSIREIRGLRVSVIVGPRAITTPEEGAALLAQYFGTHVGPDPIYVSPAGWQALEPVPAAPPVPASGPAATPAAKAARSKNSP